MDPYEIACEFRKLRFRSAPRGNVQKDDRSQRTTVAREGTVKRE